MDSMRWRRLAPPAIAVAALLVATASAPGPVGAADPLWTPPSCAAVDGKPIGARLGSAAGRVSGAAAARGVAWFRLDPTLDGDGTLVGRRLSTGDAATATRRRLDLPPESFAAGPFGDAVLVGADDGQRSTLRLVDPVAGCADDAATSAQVVRSGLVTPAGDAIVEHRVDRRTRADLGIWRRPLDGSAATRILAPLPVDAAYGPTFATELGWGTDGRLAVVSCGQVRCRARVVDPAGAAGVTVTDVGPLVGLSGGTLVVHRACASLPCPVDAIALATGRRWMLVPEAGLATLAGPQRDQVAWETTDADGTWLHRTDLTTGRTVDLGRLLPGYLPLTSPWRSASGIAAHDGAVVVTPGGRVALDVARGHGQRIDPLDGSTAALWEMDR
jgi:hypothetical protein